MCGDTGDFRQRRENQVGADRQFQRHFEQEHQRGGHERSAADSSQPDDQSDYQANNRI